jgi:uncharacterized NAD(P)/FAD-binding protein YdhS
MSVQVKIAIVGAGFSGTLVAAHLLRQTKSPLTVYLIERIPRQFGRGVAYSSGIACHLLNVPVANMSAFPDDPGHFLRWAKEREKSLINPPWVTDVAPTSFLPRRAYGDYLSWVIDEAERLAAPEVRLVRKLDKAVGISIIPDGVSLTLLSGETLQVRKVVLGLGNFLPGNPTVADPSFYESARYHGNPWSSEVLQDLLATQSCLLIGAGLTMADWAITLSEAGYRGSIHVLSRRGLWPKAHQSFSPVPFGIDPKAPPQTIRAWLHQIRQYIRFSGCDWRAVIDALRPTNQTLWKSLPISEQRRFLRHLRPFWDFHRHRLAPGIAKRLEVLVDSGQLVRHIGRVTDYRETGRDVEVLIRQRGLDRVDSVRVDAVVNCSGSESDYRELQSPLIKDLLDQGLSHPDSLSLGLDVAHDGALISADGKSSDCLFTLGPPQKGILWETTAVPEIRGQAARLATVLLGDVNGNSNCISIPTGPV